MKKKLKILLLITHFVTAVVGFALGIYALPILIAPTSPTESEINEMSSSAIYSATFKKDLKDSDLLHWGEGTISIGNDFIAFMGKISPGPDFKLYLSPEFVETEVDFNRLKHSMEQVSDIKTFNNFLVRLPKHINPSAYKAVIIWCETFGEFITAAQYQ